MDYSRTLSDGRTQARPLDAHGMDMINTHQAFDCMRASAFVYLHRRIIRGEDEQKPAFPLREVWQRDAAWQAFIDAALACHVGGRS